MSQTGPGASNGSAAYPSPKKKILFFPFARRKSASLSGQLELISQKTLDLLEEIKSFGFTKTMDEYDRRKLSIFNQLNFLQLITGIAVPLACLLGNGNFGMEAFFIAGLPPFVSFLVLCLNFYYRHEAGLLFYFLLCPVVTSIVYLNGMNLGLELYFILYGILAVFFLQELSQMLFAVGLSMVSYFVLAVVCQQYTYQLQSAKPYVYLFNQLTAIAFIFYGLFLIKKENSLYQFGILTTNHALQEKNRKIQRQKLELEETAGLLEKQTRELSDLNALKNKLFSVIAHDLKAPMYALRNLFQHMQRNNLPAAEIRKLIPEVVTELNHTTGLMENLLSWARSQMDAFSPELEELNLSALVGETVKQVSLPAQAKQIDIRQETGEDHWVRADRGMISLVLRNLLSNAIKFTPERGMVEVRVQATAQCTGFSVRDTGVGMSAEAIEKIQGNKYFTTPGTSGEAGTGLGLMLCREFLHRNGSALEIRSEPGKGTVFSFTLSRPS